MYPYDTRYNKITKILWELLRYTCKLRCIDNSTSKIIKLTIIFVEQRAIC